MIVSFLLRAWRGEEKLWKVFWLWGLLVPIALSFPLGWVEHSLLATPFHRPYLAVYWGLSAAYFWWGLVATWRCARNTDSKIFTRSMQALNVFFILALVLFFLLLAFFHVTGIFKVQDFFSAYTTCMQEITTGEGGWKAGLGLRQGALNDCMITHLPLPAPPPTMEQK